MAFFATVLFFGALVFAFLAADEVGFLVFFAAGDFLFFAGDLDPPYTIEFPLLPPLEEGIPQPEPP